MGTGRLKRSVRSVLAGSLLFGGALTAAVIGGAPSASAAKVVRTIPVGSLPYAVSSDGTHVWVANEGDGTVTEIDASTGVVVQTITVGADPSAVSSDGTHVWVVGVGVTELDASTGALVQTIPISGSAISSDGTHVWVAQAVGCTDNNNPNGTVSELDASTGALVQTITVGACPFGVSSDGTHVWVANRNDGNSGTVSELNAPTGAVVRTITVGDGPVGISSDGTHVWVANFDDGTVSELDASTGGVVQTIPDEMPYGGPGQVSSDGTHVWVANYNEQDVNATVVELDASTGKAVQTISIGSDPYAISSDGTDVWVTNAYNPTVSEIDITPYVLVKDNASQTAPGGTLTFTATVKGSGGITPTGDLTWNITDPNGDPVSCDATTGPSGSANTATYTCSINSVLGGSYVATGDYPGDSKYPPGSATDTADVDCAAPVITSSNNATPTPGNAGGPFPSFTVTTCSASTPKITATKLPKGLNLVDNGDGTATISGVFNGKDMGVYTSTITAKGTGVDARLSNTQSLYFSVFHTLKFTSKPKFTGTEGAPIFSVCGATGGGFPVTATGFPTPIVTESGTLPGGVTFDGSSETLAGTPTSGTQGTYPVTFIASADGFVPTITQQFTLTIVPADQAPIVTSAASDKIYPAAAMKPFCVTTAGNPYATLTATGVPSWLKFKKDTADGTATFTGEPPRSESGKTFHITITAENEYGSTTQAFSMIVLT
jgi:YVTN family beta-propeller protein